MPPIGSVKAAAAAALVIESVVALLDCRPIGPRFDEVALVQVSYWPPVNLQDSSSHGLVDAALTIRSYLLQLRSEDVLNYLTQMDRGQMGRVMELSLIHI